MTQSQAAGGIMFGEFLSRHTIFILVGTVSILLVISVSYHHPIPRFTMNHRSSILTTLRFLIRDAKYRKDQAVFRNASGKGVNPSL